MDTETILTSVRKTGRCVIVHEAPQSCGVGSEIIARINDCALLRLEAPVARVAKAGLTRLNKGEVAFSQAIEETMADVTPDLKKRIAHDEADSQPEQEARHVFSIDAFFIQHEKTPDGYGAKKSEALRARNFSPVIGEICVSDLKSLLVQNRAGKSPFSASRAK